MRIYQSIILFFILIFMTIFLFPPASSAITIREEEKLGDEFMKYMNKNLKLIQDHSIVNYVSRVGNRIVEVLPSKLFTYHFYVVNEHVYNAFAGPGAHIFINSGLLEAMENEEELAGILAHEITHVSCRHISERIERSKKLSIASLAGIIAAVFIGGDPGSAVAMGTVAAGQSFSLAYSRKNEREADQNGLRYLRMAGYGGKGLLNVLKKIRVKNWIGTTQIPGYMMTHPGIEERLAYIDTLLESYSEHAETTRKINRYKFNKFHARLTGLVGNKEKINSFKEDILKNPKDALAHYGAGLILSRIGKRKQGISYLRTALQYQQLDSDILRDLGKMYFYDGQYWNALNTLKKAIKLGNNNPDARFLLARTQVNTDQFKNAIRNFKRLLILKNKYPRLHYYLGEAYGKLGKLTDAHYHLGLFYKNKNNIRNAKFHLNKALKKIKNDPDRKAEIEKVLKDL
ncbi:beta-barrel assembly-enhancing protease [Candidatus Magnetomoraceae bacterium gMMP-15]